MNAAFDFGAFPPEVNSAKMYAGPGSGSMLSAAATWNELASELRSQATDYNSTISNLTGASWQGRASTAMASAAARYTSWMDTTAARAEQTARQARAAAAAYETAYGMTVPPPVIAANRTQLASLVATNLLGQNGPAIAATEAHYGQMWAQDATAMYGYAAQSATATNVPSFTTAPPTTTTGALVGQAAAATQTTGSGTQAALSQLTSAVPGTLQGMATPATATSSSTSALSELESLFTSGSSGNSQLDSFWSAWGPNANIWNTLTSTGAINPLQAAQIVTGAGSLGPGTAAGSEGLSGLSPLGMAAGLGEGTPGVSGAAGLGGAGSSLSAGVGQATSLGPLSVPPNWSAAAPSATSPAAPALGSSPLAAPPEVAGVPGVAPTGASLGARAGASAGIIDNRFLIRPPMVPSWAAVG